MRKTSSTNILGRAASTPSQAEDDAYSSAGSMLLEPFGSKASFLAGSARISTKALMTSSTFSANAWGSVMVPMQGETEGLLSPRERPSFTFLLGKYVVRQREGLLRLPVRRRGAVAEASKLAVCVLDEGTAFLAMDFVLLNSVLTFMPGQRDAQLEVVVLNNPRGQHGRWFKLKLNDPATSREEGAGFKTDDIHVACVAVEDDVYHPAGRVLRSVAWCLTVGCANFYGIFGLGCALISLPKSSDPLLLGLGCVALTILIADIVLNMLVLGKTYSRSVPCVLDALAAVGLFSELVFVFWNSSWAGNMAAPMYLVLCACGKGVIAMLRGELVVQLIGPSMRAATAARKLKNWIFTSRLLASASGRFMRLKHVVIPSKVSTVSSVADRSGVRFEESSTPVLSSVHSLARTFHPKKESATGDTAAPRGLHFSHVHADSGGGERADASQRDGAPSSPPATSSPGVMSAGVYRLLAIRTPAQDRVVEKMVAAMLVGTGVVLAFLGKERPSRTIQLIRILAAIQKTPVPPPPDHTFWSLMRSILEPPVQGNAKESDRDLIYLKIMGYEHLHQKKWLADLREIEMEIVTDCDWSHGSVLHDLTQASQGCLSVAIFDQKPDLENQLTDMMIMAVLLMVLMLGCASLIAYDLKPLHKLAGMLRFMILNDSLDTSKPRKLNRSTTTTTRSFWGTIKVALARLLPSPMNTNSVQENQTLLVSACEDLEDALGVPLARVKQGVVAAMHDHDALAEEIARITSSLAEQSLTLMEAATRLLGVLQWLPPQLSSKLPSVEAVGAWVEPVEELLRMELATLGLPEQRPSLLALQQLAGYVFASSVVLPQLRVCAYITDGHVQQGVQELHKQISKDPSTKGLRQGMSLIAAHVVLDQLLQVHINVMRDMNIAALQLPPTSITELNNMIELYLMRLALQSVQAMPMNKRVWGAIEEVLLPCKTLDSFREGMTQLHNKARQSDWESADSSPISGGADPTGPGYISSPEPKSNPEPSDARTSLASRLIMGTKWASAKKKLDRNSLSTFSRELLTALDALEEMPLTLVALLQGLLRKTTHEPGHSTLSPVAAPLSSPLKSKSWRAVKKRARGRLKTPFPESKSISSVMANQMALIMHCWTALLELERSKWELTAFPKVIGSLLCEMRKLAVVKKMGGEPERGVVNLLVQLYTKSNMKKIVFNRFWGFFNLDDLQELLSVLIGYADNAAVAQIITNLVSPMEDEALKKMIHQVTERVQIHQIHRLLVALLSIVPDEVVNSAYPRLMQLVPSTKTLELVRVVLGSEEANRMRSDMMSTPKKVRRRLSSMMGAAESEQAARCKVGAADLKQGVELLYAEADRNLLVQWLNILIQDEDTVGLQAVIPSALQDAITAELRCYMKVALTSVSIDTARVVASQVTASVDLPSVARLFGEMMKRSHQLSDAKHEMISLTLHQLSVRDQRFFVKVLLDRADRAQSQHMLQHVVLVQLSAEILQEMLVLAVPDMDDDEVDLLLAHVLGNVSRDSLQDLVSELAQYIARVSVSHSHHFSRQVLDLDIPPEDRLMALLDAVHQLRADLAEAWVPAWEDGEDHQPQHNSYKLAESPYKLRRLSSNEESDAVLDAIVTKQREKRASMLAVSEQDVESAGLALDVGGVARSHTNGSAQSSVEQSGSDCAEPVRVNKTRKTTRRSRKQSLEMMQTFRVMKPGMRNFDIAPSSSENAFQVSRAQTGESCARQLSSLCLSPDASDASRDFDTVPAQDLECQESVPSASQGVRHSSGAPLEPAAVAEVGRASRSFEPASRLPSSRVSDHSSGGGFMKRRPSKIGESLHSLEEAVQQQLNLKRVGLHETWKPVLNPAENKANLAVEFGAHAVLNRIPSGCLPPVTEHEEEKEEEVGTQMAFLLRETVKIMAAQPKHTQSLLRGLAATVPEMSDDNITLLNETAAQRASQVLLREMLHHLAECITMKDLTQCREEMAQNTAEHAQVMLDASLEATSSLDSGQLQTLADALVFHVEVEELGQILRTVTATMDVQQRVEVLLGSTMDRQEAHAPAMVELLCDSINIMVYDKALCVSASLIQHLSVAQATVYVQGLSKSSQEPQWVAIREALQDCASRNYEAWRGCQGEVETMTREALRMLAPLLQRVRDAVKTLVPHCAHTDWAPMLRTVLGALDHMELQDAQEQVLVEAMDSEVQRNMIAMTRVATQSQLRATVEMLAKLASNSILQRHIDLAKQGQPEEKAKILSVVMETFCWDKKQAVLELLTESLNTEQVHMVIPTVLAGAFEQTLRGMVLGLVTESSAASPRVLLQATLRVVQPNAVRAAAKELIMFMNPERAVEFIQNTVIPESGMDSIMDAQARVDRARRAFVQTVCGDVKHAVETTASLDNTTAPEDVREEEADTVPVQWAAPLANSTNVIRAQSAVKSKPHGPTEASRSQSSTHPEARRPPRGTSRNPRVEFDANTSLDPVDVANPLLTWTPRLKHELQSELDNPAISVSAIASALVQAHEFLEFSTKHPGGHKVSKVLEAMLQHLPKKQLIVVLLEGVSDQTATARAHLVMRYGLLCSPAQQDAAISVLADEVSPAMLTKVVNSASSLVDVAKADVLAQLDPKCDKAAVTKMHTLVEDLAQKCDAKGLRRILTEVMQDQLDCPQMQQLLVELAGRMNMDDLVYLADAVLKVVKSNTVAEVVVIRLVHDNLYSAISFVEQCFDDDIESPPVKEAFSNIRMLAAQRSASMGCQSSVTKDNSVMVVSELAMKKELIKASYLLEEKGLQRAFRALVGYLPHVEATVMLMQVVQLVHMDEVEWMMETLLQQIDSITTPARQVAKLRTAVNIAARVSTPEQIIYIITKLADTANLDDLREDIYRLFGDGNSQMQRKGRPMSARF